MERKAYAIYCRNWTYVHRVARNNRMRNKKMGQNLDFNQFRKQLRKENSMVKLSDQKSKHAEGFNNKQWKTVAQDLTINQILRGSEISNKDSKAKIIRQLEHLTYIRKTIPSNMCIF